jgi:hypothetical protein
MSMGRVVLAALGALLAVGAAPALAQPTDVQVKAAFLPRFARYVTWPPAAAPKGADPFLLCVVGADPFGPALDQAVRSQLVDGRRIVVRRLETADGAERCHIAFVDGSKSRPVAPMLAAVSARPVLTVTDQAAGGTRGIIHFAVVSGRVRFFIDDAAAAKRGMTISSRLLALAVGVRQR